MLQLKDVKGARSWFDCNLKLYNTCKGSTGVIGRKVVESLIQRGHSVVALIRPQNNPSGTLLPSDDFEDRRLQVEQKLSKLGATLQHIDDILGTLFLTCGLSLKTFLQLLKQQETHKSSCMISALLYSF